MNAHHSSRESPRKRIDCCVRWKRSEIGILDVLQVRNGANVDYETKAGDTALIRAAVMGRTEAISALVDAGASVDYITPDANTALLAASQKGQIGAVRTLCAWCGRKY